MDNFKPTFNIEEAVRKVLPYMMEMREYFHANPELSDQEYATSRMIFQELSLMGVEGTKIIAGTGVCGLIKGRLPGPVILLRADIDALPLTEKVDVPYASLKKGVMHACGHDGHIANLLGVSKILTQHRDCLRGTVRVVFQPAEEGNGGAARMIDLGILNRPHVDYAIGLHIAGSLPKGKVTMRSGAITASCDDFTITLYGKGGHGAQPSECINPIQMGIDIIQEIQAYVYNCRQDSDGIVLSFGQFRAGVNPNVIPDTAILKGTLRTYNESKRILILKKLQHIIESVASCYDGSCQFDVVPFAPICFNDAAVTKKVSTILNRKCTPLIRVVPQARSSGSEDFAYFSAVVPSTFYYVGINNGKEEFHHSSNFQWDSDALKYTCDTMTNIVYYFDSF